MKYGDERIYRTFEEFEREELRRSDGLGGSMDEMVDAMFAEELDFDFKSPRHKAGDEDDQD
jgi:hypothetical protein